MSLGLVFLSEVFGTAMLTLLGCGVVANVALKGTKGNNGGFLMVTSGGASPSSPASTSPSSRAPTSTPPSPSAFSPTARPSTRRAFRSTSRPR